VAEINPQSDSQIYQDAYQNWKNTLEHQLKKEQ
jgi:hypothetical protein